MKSLDTIMSEENVVAVSEKIMSATKEKIKEQLANEFYNQVEGYLYEHYQNHKEKIERELIAEITEQFVKEPNLYKYEKLRAKIWEENKDAIINTLTDETIKDSMENALMIYTHRSNHFNWQWKDGIVRVILANWDKFKDDERIEQQFGRERNRLNNIISDLRERLGVIENATNEEY